MNVSKITNRIAIAAIALLIYWVFIFISMEVFGFKVFRQNITEIYFLSILGIFAILAGALILNIMFNLSAIADKYRPEKPAPWKYTKHTAVAVLLSFPLIFGLLYSGDYATTKQKEQRLINAAQSLVNEEQKAINKLFDYSFSREYINKASEAIKYLSQIEESFPNVVLIQRDSIDEKSVLLNFGVYHYNSNKNQPLKVDYILSTSAEERSYLNSIFDGNSSEPRYSSNDGKYELYFPVKTEKGLLVLYLSERSRYGKIGS